MHTTKRGLELTRERYRGDWDAAGTVSVHLPIDVAHDLLEDRGWSIRGAEWISPTVPAAASYVKIKEGRLTSEVISSTGDALQVALTAETLAFQAFVVVIETTDGSVRTDGPYSQDLIDSAVKQIAQRRAERRGVIMTQFEDDACATAYRLGDDEAGEDTEDVYGQRLEPSVHE